MSRMREIVDGIFRRGTRFFKGYGVSLDGFKLSNLPFAEVVFYNAVGLLTDLCSDVTWKFGKGQESLAAAFIRFYNVYSKLVYNRYYDEGFVVIAHEYVGEGASRADSFRLARKTEFTKFTKDNIVSIKPSQSALESGVELYVMVSDVYESKGKSHKELAAPFMVYLDNAFNASNTITQRLGAMVVASPKGTQNTFGRLNEQEKKEIEAEIRKDYGALIQQSQFLLLPKEMDMQVISLATLDIKTETRVRNSVLAIADLVKVPANQIAMIDADSSKALSNGSELVAGDLAKYKSFERLLDATFVRMAIDLGLAPGDSEEIDGVPTPIYYGIYNKPSQPTEEGVDVTTLNSDMLGVLTTDEKREALGYNAKGADSNETVLAQTLGVGGTQSLVAIIESETLSDDEKRGTLEVLFGLSKEQVIKLIPYKTEIQQ